MTVKTIASLAPKASKAADVLINKTPKNKNFNEVMLQQKGISESGKPDLFKEIQEMQKSVLSGKEFSGKDLILYQIKVGQFGLRVELISKVAESAVGTVKKFQNPQ